MDVVASGGFGVCALVCLLFFFVTVSWALVFLLVFGVCVYIHVLVFCAWLSAGKMRGCLLPGTAERGFGGGLAPFDVSPLFIHVLPVGWLTLASWFVQWF